ncbi:MAG: hypothetical protein JXB23_17225 [Candidatus Aminicenantes bacterium]|nr:hypothetical protein [Candidatus Aminicenantes bacterium]
MDNKWCKEFRFLKAYAVVSSVLLIGLIFVAAHSVTKNAKFEEIDVERINIVEPDGSLRMVITDKARLPGLILKGKEYVHDRQTAGIIFFNDEQTENGGLIFGGMKNEDGTPISYGHLSFDAYEQDQVLTIDAGQEGKKKVAGMAIIDRPDYPIIELVELMERLKNLPEEQQKAEMEKFQAEHPAPSRRLYLGRAEDNSVGIKLLDPQGRERILIQVAHDGSPILKFLDEDGKVIYRIPE